MQVYCITIIHYFAIWCLGIQNQDDNLELGKDVAGNNSLNPETLTEERLENLLQNQGNPREELHVCIAMEATWSLQVFCEDDNNWEVSVGWLPISALSNDMKNLLEWKAQMNEEINKQNVIIRTLCDTGKEGVEIAWGVQSEW